MNTPRPEFSIRPVENGFIVTKTGPNIPAPASSFSNNVYVFESVDALNNFLLGEYYNE